MPIVVKPRKRKRKDISHSRSIKVASPAKRDRRKVRRASPMNTFNKWLDENIDFINEQVRKNTKRLTGKEVL